MPDYKNFVLKSREFLKNYIKKYNLKSLICGISGGIDSTLSCAIAYPVCKELNIPLIGRSLPTTSNKIDETTTAFKIGEAFCDDFKEVPIENSFNIVFSDLVLNEGHITKLQEGNIKARLRMIYLRHLASIHKGVVLDNDNFTEWNLGFWTVGGDSPMDLNLGLHYLWKTEVYELAKYLLQCYEGDKFQAIEASFNLIPTDGNGVSKSDCEQFGLDNYEQVDDVLKTMYFDISLNNLNKPTVYENLEIKQTSDKAKLHLSEYIRLIDSYNEQGVDKVMMLHQNTEFKRHPSPIMPDKVELGL